MEFDYRIVRDKTRFKENVLPQHSDHVAYKNRKEAGEGKNSLRKSLNGSWKFHYAKNYASAVPGFFREDYDVSGWDDIPVPAHIQLQGYDRPAYLNIQYPWDGAEDLKPGEIPELFNPVGSYVTFFTVPEGWKDRKICINFDGVESGFALWINGKYTGYSEDSFTEAAFDITGCLKEGENRLAVQVFKWTPGSWFEDQDFFIFSGIFRNVYLYAVPGVHVYDLKIRPLPDSTLKKGTLEITLDMGKDGGSIEYALSFKGETILSKEIPAKKRTVIKEKVEKPELWSAEYPNLYDITFTVKGEDNEVTEYIEEKAGFRRFEIKDGLMKLNGKRIVFNGVNRHEFSSVKGRVPDPDAMLSDVLFMKRNNINAVRTSHYPDAHAFYRLCDIYGIYLIAENNMETHGVWEAFRLGKTGIDGIIPGDKDEYRDMLLDRANSTYQRSKNHPSVLIWSCGNESYSGSVIQAMSDFFRKADPDRLVHYEGGDWDKENRYPDMTDMYSRMYPPAAECETFINAPEHQDKPFILCEYAHSMGNAQGDMQTYTELSERYERYQGGFIWDLVDQTITKKNHYGEEFQAYGGDHGERPTDYDFSANGLLDGLRRPYAGKVQAVKYNYQGIRIEIERKKKGFTALIKNKYLFTPTSDFDCFLRVEKEGHVISEEKTVIDVPPLLERRTALPVPEIPEEGEYTVTLSFRLKEDKAYAKKGHEAAFGQGIFRAAGKRSATAKSREDAGVFRVVRGCFNTGIHGEGFDILLSSLKGGIISYRYQGREMLPSVPRPNFWRAPTQNDNGNLMAFRQGFWKNASNYQTHIRPGESPFDPESEARRYPVIRENPDYAEVSWKKYLPSPGLSFVTTTYRIFKDGRVRVILDYEPEESLPPMPEFGFLFKLDKEYDRVVWYGLGPEENYCDRTEGARLGVYERRVPEMAAQYVVPQETGNRSGVRWGRVLDKNGRGLEFRFVSAGADKDGMDFSALFYTPDQLEEAAHPYELPSVHFTVVRLSMKQMGVGGDDAWGAPVLPQYMLPRDKHLHFEFEFRGVG
ncbi:MAG: DUF4981 domain-containing protein [Lachnospiraceae bacterium]|nr:DUF4981 domain-containing protein [Lachnospiraceae bacterium]